MLSTKLKKEIKKSLLENYGINCYKIIMSSRERYNQKEFELFCELHSFKFTLRLVLNMTSDDFESSNEFEFNILISLPDSDFVVSQKAYPSNLIKSIFHVQSEFEKLKFDQKLILNHVKLSLVSGTVIYEKGFLTVPRFLDQI